MGKFSKKKFNAGLESLFEETTEAFLSETVALVDEKEKEDIPKRAPKTRARGNKSFMSDLDSLLENALSDDDNNYQDPEKKRPVERKAKKRPIAISGLDALIRKTVDFKDTNEDTEKKTKRVTISVDKRRLQKLKHIARVEKAYLKDILGTLIADYIKKYEIEN